MTKTVLITGSSTGIGYTTAIYFAKKHWNVIATMRNDHEKVIFQEYPNITVLKLDVRDKKSIKQCFAVVEKKFRKIDVVINNAGLGIYKPFELTSDDEIKHLFETNLFGTMHVCRAALPIMRKQRKGTIINVSSAVGVLAMPFYTIYCSTKFGVEGFSEALYYETLPFGVNVKIIEPGAIKTDFFRNAKNLPQRLGKDKIKSVNNEIYTEYHQHFPQSLERKKSFEITPAEKVAATIYRAATDRNKKLRYVVGIDSKVAIALRKLLPQWLFLRMLRVVKRERI